jgi:hypothetical protein
MPAMAPMNYQIDAKLKGDQYRAAMDLIMAGRRVLAVRISPGGKMTATRFNINELTKSHRGEHWSF